MPLTAVAWAQSTSVSGRKKTQKHPSCLLPASQLLPDVTFPRELSGNSMYRRSLPWFCQACLIQRILLNVQANLDHSRMGLVSKYVSNYGGKSERMIEMIGIRDAVRRLNFSK